jgi:Carboxypeptidase regulatory-like domain
VATAVTGEDGTYQLPGLPGGEHTLVASGYPPASSAVHVENGKTATVTVRLGGGQPGEPGQLPGAQAAEPSQPGLPARPAQPAPPGSLTD